MHEEILDFINRRFKDNCHWLDGNCYYFAVILKERFPGGQIYYDMINCHFCYGINGKFYDWTGAILPDGRLIPWKVFKLFDKTYFERVMRDCVR